MFEKRKIDDVFLEAVCLLAEDAGHPMEVPDGNPMNYGFRPREIVASVSVLGTVLFKLIFDSANVRDQPRRERKRLINDLAAPALRDAGNFLGRAFAEYYVLELEVALEVGEDIPGPAPLAYHVRDVMRMATATGEVDDCIALGSDLWREAIGKAKDPQVEREDVAMVLSYGRGDYELTCGEHALQITYGDLSGTAFEGYSIERRNQGDLLLPALKVGAGWGVIWSDYVALLNQFPSLDELPEVWDFS